MQPLFTKDKQKVLIDATGTCSVYDQFDTLLESSFPLLRLCPQFSINSPYHITYIPQKCILIGPYGLKGGGISLCKCFSPSKNDPVSIIRSKIESKIQQPSLNQPEIQHEISESLALLKEGCEKSLIENIVQGIKYLSQVPYHDYANPLTVSLTLLESLSAESMWEQVSWSEVRKMLAKTARRLLSYSFYKSKNRVQMFAQTKDKVIPFANSIIDRVLEEEENFPENGLLCEMKSILSTIKVMKDSERWYKSLWKKGVNLYEVLFNKDSDALKQLGLSLADFVLVKINHRMSIHLFCLDFIERQPLPFKVEWLSIFLTEFKAAKWEILHAILDETEAVLLDPALSPSDLSLLFSGSAQRTGVKSLAAFNSYTFIHNWRIRRKVAKILTRLINSESSLKTQASEIIAERIVFETDSRIKEIYSNPALIQAAHDLIEHEWEIKKPRFEELLEEEKAILLGLEKKFNEAKSSEKQKMMEMVEQQRAALETQVNELTAVLASIGKASDFIDKYENYATQSKNELLSAIHNSAQHLERNIDRKFSDVMHKINLRSPRSDSASLYSLPNSVPFFTGREDDLSQLHSYMVQFSKRIFIIAVVGMGGVGKTQLALEFANSQRDNFSLIWFIAAESKVKIETGLLEIAQSLGLDLEQDRKLVIRQVMGSLAKQRKPWMLILDGVVNPKDVDSFIPQGRGMILATSRNPCWDLAIALQALDRTASVKLLLRISKLKDETGADRIAEELGDHPLALCQAASFIKQTKSDFDEYLYIYKSRSSSIMDISEDNSGLGASWRINLQQIKEISDTCRKWIDSLALLSTNRIPDLLAREIYRQIEGIDNALKYRKAIKLALDYSLIEVGEDKAVSMHKLVQQFVRKLQKPDKATVENMEAVFLELFSMQQDLDFNSSLAAHLEVFLANTLSVSAEAGELYSRLGIYYLEVNHNIALAAKYINSSLKIKVEKFGKTSVEAAQIYNNLGNVYFEENNLNQAIQYYRKALMIKKRHLEPNALEVAYSYNNLGICFFQQSNMVEAVNYITKAMEIMKVQLGEDDLSITTTYMNLGMAYDELGEYDKAEKYLGLAMEIRRKAINDGHPDIADCLLNMGILHCKSGKDKEGAEEVKSALLMLEQTLGTDSPVTKNAREHYLKIGKMNKVMIT